MNNFGYQAIMDTQKTYFIGNRFLVESDSGLSLPNFSKILEAFNLNFCRFRGPDLLGENRIIEWIKKKGPLVLDVLTPMNIPMTPYTEIDTSCNQTVAILLPTTVPKIPHLSNKILDEIFQTSNL